jgi:hypothetical protein
MRKGVICGIIFNAFGYGSLQTLYEIAFSNDAK